MSSGRRLTETAPDQANTLQSFTARPSEPEEFWHSKCDGCSPRPETSDEKEPHNAAQHTKSLEHKGSIYLNNKQTQGMSDVHAIHYLQAQALALRDDLLVEIQNRAGFEEKKKELQRALDGKDMEIKDLRAQLELSKVHLSDLMSSFQRAQSDLRAARNEREILKRENAATATELKLHLAEFEKLQESMHLQKANTDELNDEVRKLKQLQSLRLSKLMDSENAAIMKLKDSQAEVEFLRSTCESNKIKSDACILDLRTSLQAANLDLDALRNETMTLKKKYNSLDQKVEELTHLLSTARRDLEDAHSEVERLQSADSEASLFQVTQHELRVHKLENLLAASRLRLKEEHRQEVAKLKASYELRISEMESSLKAARLEMERFERDILSDASARDVSSRLQHLHRALRNSLFSFETVLREMGRLRGEAYGTPHHNPHSSPTGELDVVLTTAKSTLEQAKADVIVLQNVISRQNGPLYSDKS